MRALLATARSLPDWPAFAGSWNRLELDHYLAATGRRRLRRHATFLTAPSGELALDEYKPHFQSIENNRLQGGVERWFEPFEPETAASPSLAALITFGCRVFSTLEPVSLQTCAWHIEAHQFRIEALREGKGEPTPEGIHRDGVDWVLVVLIDRVNIASGTTTVYSLDGVPMGSFTLTQPLDAALVDDRRMLHGVTAVSAIDPLLPAYRDVLVVTYRVPPGARL